MHFEDNGGIAIVFYRLSFSEIVRGSHGSGDCDLQGLKQLQAREILRIDDADRHLVVIDYDQVVDAVAFEQIENFDRELVFVHRDRIQRHQIGDEALADFESV